MELLPCVNSFVFSTEFMPTPVILDLSKQILVGQQRPVWQHMIDLKGLM